jgi:glycine cleavage system H protein
MNALRYSEEHEWVGVEGDVATVGISNFAQEQLGDLVFVELPEVGTEVSAGEQVAVVESVKAASEVFSPVSGEIVEVNDAIVEEPAGVNGDAEGDGWFFKIRLSDPSELDGLMDAKAYKAFVKD